MTNKGTYNEPFDLTTAKGYDWYRHGDCIRLADGNYSMGTIAPTVNGATALTPMVITGSENTRFITGTVLSSNNTRLENITNNYDAMSSSDRYSQEYNCDGGVNLIGGNTELRDMVISNGGGLYAPNDNETYPQTIDGCIIYYHGWLWETPTGDGDAHGHGVYIHRREVTIKNCIVFYNASFGIQVYGGVDLDHITLQNNICFATGEMFKQDVPILEANIIETAGNQGGDNQMVWDNNCTYVIGGTGRDNDFGFGNVIVDGTLTDNYMPEGITYMVGSTFLDNSGNVTAPEETNYIRVIPVRGRAHVAVYNWEGLETVTIDLSTVPDMNVGDKVLAISVIDYWVDRVEKTLDASKCITISMKAVDHTIEQPLGMAYSPASTFPEFGCFVVRHV